MRRNKVLIDSKYGNLNGDDIVKKVTILGSPSPSDDSYIEKLNLLIEDAKEKNTFDLNLSGYEFNLFLVNLSDEDTYQILITGQYGESYELSIVRLYEYKNNKLKLLLNESDLSNFLSCSAKYLDDKYIEVTCPASNKKYTLDISNHYKNYPGLIYDDDGKLILDTVPTVSDVNVAFPVIATYSNTYSLLVQQLILGLSPNDILGIIQSTVDSDDNKNLVVKEQYLLQFGESL